MNPASLLRRLRLLDSRLGRRLFALFVASALLPLAVSDWLTLHTVGQSLREQATQAQARLTHDLSRAVFDRLLTARSLLLSLPAAGAPTAAQQAELGHAFAALADLDDQGRIVWHDAAGANLGSDWANGIGQLAAQPINTLSSDGTASDALSAALRVLPAPSGQPPRVLLALLDAGRPRWVAELRPDFLWQPLRDAPRDTAWAVRDAQSGLLLAQSEGASDPPDAAQTARSRSLLFLRSDFAAADWQFDTHGALPQARWMGWPLASWLQLAAAATLLLIALLAVAQIRRTLVPLDRLTAGANRLGAGELDARVDVRSDDELGDLSRAFNHMAQRLGQQVDALQALAAIDRDILEGAGLARVAEQIVQRLHALYPDRHAALLWREAPDALRLHRRSARGEHIADGVQPPADWDHLRSEQVCTVDARCASAWAPLLGLPAGAALALLAVKHDGRTRAVLALALDPATSPDPQAELQPVRDLRDRFAVAWIARERERDLVHQATHDSLTGLRNRSGLHAWLDAALGGAAPSPLAVLFIDLDAFKQINDRHGHDRGDALLRIAAERLRATAPPGACVARQGGDEFVVVLPQADAASARAWADDAIRRLAEPLSIGPQRHAVGASIGIALAPQHGTTRQELMRCADIALYAAKAAGRGRAAVFTPALDEQAREQAVLGEELRQALAARALIAHYQPRVDAVGGRVRSVEALARWPHPRRGLVAPGRFIPVAEATGQINTLGALMLDLACAQMARWRQQGLGIEQVSVNVSAPQFRPGDLVGQVRDALARHRLPPQALELEITESLLVDDTARAGAQLAALREMGVSISLDDFGTGYASMAALRRLPLDAMKIDRSFVIDLETDPGALAVVRAIVSLAQASGLRLVAEGVETPRQAQVLRELGCDELQGFLFSRPLPAEQITPAALAALPA